MHNWKIISLTLLAKEYQFKCVFNTIRVICTSDYCMWLVLDQQECGTFGDLQCKTYTIGLQVSEKGICITCVLRTINSQHMIWKPLLGIHDGLKPDTIEQKISSISIFVAWAHWLNIFRVLKFLHWGPMTNISCCIYMLGPYRNLTGFKAGGQFQSRLTRFPTLLVPSGFEAG